MPDQIEPIPAAQGQADWPAMLHDLEKRVEVLSDALEGVKLSIRRLVLAEPWLQTPYAAEPVHMDPVSMPEPEQPVAYAEPIHQDALPAYAEAPAFYEEAPAYDEPEIHHDAPSYNFDAPAYEAVAPPVEPEPAYLPVSYDEDAREAVRRAVEEAKAQMAAGQLRDETHDNVTDDKPDVSWVTVPDDGSPPEPLPTFDEPVVAQQQESDEDAREAVRRAVEQMKADLSSGDFSHEEVAPQVMDAAVDEPKVEEEEAEDPREAVRRAVEQARAEMSRPGYVPPPLEELEEPAPAPAAFNDDEAAREAVRQAVEQAKAERSFAENAIGTLSEEEAAREAVRQAVAKARTEMATTGTISEEEPEPVVKQPAFVVPPPHRPERVHPPTITIEDPEGRVELARVYNLLKRLDVAANSSLLNYSARQVSVQLSDAKVPPDGDDVGTAVREVFERQNDVSVDGVNVIVKLGSDQEQAA